MKVNFNTPIKQLSGQQMQEQAYRSLADGEERIEGRNYTQAPDGHWNEVVVVPLFARNFVVHALGQDYPDEQATIDHKEKYSRYKLLQRIEESKDNIGDNLFTSVNSEEIQTISRLVSKLYNPVVVGQIIDLLEGE